MGTFEASRAGAKNELRAGPPKGGPAGFSLSYRTSEAHRPRQS